MNQSQPNLFIFLSKKCSHSHHPCSWSSVTTYRGIQIISCWSDWRLRSLQYLVENYSWADNLTTCRSMVGSNAIWCDFESKAIWISGTNPSVTFAIAVFHHARLKLYWWIVSLKIANAYSNANNVRNSTYLFEYRSNLWTKLYIEIFFDKL